MVMSEKQKKIKYGRPIVAEESDIAFGAVVSLRDIQRTVET